MGLCHGKSRRVFPADPFDQHTKRQLSNHTTVPIHTPYVSAGFGSVGMYLAEHIRPRAHTLRGSPSQRASSHAGPVKQVISLGLVDDSMLKISHDTELPV
jgi:hypothetical protein